MNVSRLEGAERKNYAVSFDSNSQDENTAFVLQPQDIIIVGTVVAVTPSEVEKKYISVLGQVKSPGRFEFKQGMMVVDAIAVAGGLTPTAASNGVKVIRLERGVKKTIVIPLGSILQGASKAKDVMLRQGDTIVVPESFF